MEGLRNNTVHFIVNLYKAFINGRDRAISLITGVSTNHNLFFKINKKSVNNGVGIGV